MPTYQRKQKAIEATRFTSDHGGIVRGVTPGDAPVGLAYSEHGGYTFHGTRIAFGDYMVGHSVVSGEVFEREYEEVIGVPFSALSESLSDAPSHVKSSSGVPIALEVRDASAASVLEAVKPKTRSKRAQESE